MFDRSLLSKIEDLNFWHREQDVGIKREELKEMLKFSEDIDFALSIIGIRRAGKTYLAKQLLHHKIENGIKKEQTLYINFEDPALEPYLNVESLELMYNTYRYYLNQKARAYIILDEVHNVEKWEKWVRIKLEKKEDVKFIITGSGSKSSKSDLSTLLTGRTVTLPIFPLSFASFLEFKDYKIGNSESYTSLSFLLAEYLEYGGFPLIVLAERDKKTTYLKQLFDDIITKDIIAKYKLRDTEVRKLAVILLNNFSSLTSVTKLSNLMQTITRVKLSPSSINDYLHYFEDSFLFFFVPIFSYKIKDAMQYSRKAYCNDVGLVNAISMRFSENIGKLYENVVAIELIKKFGKENIFYWKNRNGNEVDFIVKNRFSVEQLIQVCYDMDNETVKKREVIAILKAAEELKCKKLIIITKETDKKENIGKKEIIFVPLWKWLLS